MTQTAAPTWIASLPELSLTAPIMDSKRPIPVSWRDSAACLDEDPELFFPSGISDPARFQIEQAKAVCRRCQVAETCLRWAIESHQYSGVWGGLSAAERQAL